MPQSSVIITQDSLAPGAIKQRHLSASPTQKGDIYYGKDGNSLTNVAIGTSGQTLTVASGVPTWVTNDGWLTSADTFTYASASSFTISGVNRTTVYTPGTRVKFTNNAVTYYGVVASSSFSTNTTVTLIANSDYSIANSAITSPFYSYQENPAGYPGWFNFAPGYTGFSANPSGGINQFAVSGRVCFVTIAPTVAGTSNGTGFTIVLPVAATQLVYLPVSLVADNSTWNAGRINTTASSTTLTLTYGFAGASWTNTGNKMALLNFAYPF